ncbi:hypothetical protein [Microbacterium sp.]|uniref:hypothetical protein n=1 Tax=Microbacterium sp. TaxID=51671 RepID=UPI003A8D84D9
MEKKRPEDPERPAAIDAEEALREASSAAEAAKAESDRWGGADKTPTEPGDRYW